MCGVNVRRRSTRVGRLRILLTRQGTLTRAPLVPETGATSGGAGHWNERRWQQSSRMSFERMMMLMGVIGVIGVALTLAWMMATIS